MWELFLFLAFFVVITQLGLGLPNAKKIVEESTPIPQNLFIDGEEAPSFSLVFQFFSLLFEKLRQVI